MNPLQSVPRLLYVLIGVLILSWLATVAAIVTHEISADKTLRDLRLYHLPVMRASSQISRDLLVIQRALTLYSDAVERDATTETILRYRQEASLVIERVTSVIDQNVAAIVRAQKQYNIKAFEKSTDRFEAAWEKFRAASHRTSSGGHGAGEKYQNATEMFLIRAVQLERLHGDPEEQISNVVTEQQGRVRTAILLSLALLISVGGPLSYRTTKAILSSVRHHDYVLTQLAERETRLAEAQRVAHVGSWEWGVNDDKVIWSDESYRIFGQVPGEFETTFASITALMTPDDAEKIAEVTQNAINAGESYEVEHRLVRPDGEERHLMERGEVREWGPDGRPTRLQGTMQDITERKLAEDQVRDLNRTLEETVHQRTAELQGQKDFSEMLLEAVGEGIYGIDMEGNCTFINPAACKMLGAQPVTILGLNAHDIMHHTRPDGSPYPVHTCHIYQAFKDGKTTTVSDELFWRQDGSSFPVEYTSSPIVMDGKIRGAVVVFRDITESRSMQAQLVQASKLATLGEMATGIAHELNQPLNVIRLAAGNVLRRHERAGLEPEFMVEKLERIESQTQRATEIIDHMRVFGRKSDSRPQAVDLNDAVRGALDMVAQQIKIAEIDVEMTLAEEGAFVTGHAVQLEQVCLNLLNNARDAVSTRAAREPKEEFPKRIQINTHCDDVGKIAELRISDSGGGVPSEVLDRIFEPFFTTKEIGKGTGLGLSISYGIVDDMKGDISARNVDGGAEFTVTLPAADRMSQEKAG